MVKEKIIYQKDHHHWHIDMMIRELFFLLLILTVILSMVRIIEDSVSREQDMYNSCLDVCSARPTSWNQNPESVILNYDRVECVRACNSFHKTLEVN